MTTAQNQIEIAPGVVLATYPAEIGWDYLKEPSRRALLAKLATLRALPQSEWEPHGVVFHDPPESRRFDVEVPPEYVAFVTVRPDSSFALEGFVLREVFDRDEGESR